MNAMTPTGVIHGGWSFVVAAYSVTAVVLGGYALTIYLRYRSERDRAAREPRGEGTER
jgi:acyl-coenzyme A thioesterase PaaI-like protein